jgi:CelD/BcsL family acetyltransferase involved in cellulose biosynthesis
MSTAPTSATTATPAPMTGARTLAARLAWTVLPAAQLKAHAADWDALQAASTRTPFLQTDFLLPLLEVFGQGRELLALGRAADGRLRAAALLQPRGPGQWETFQPSQLPLGPWVGHGGDDLAEVGRSLLPRLPRLALTLGLTQIDPHLLPRPADGAAQQTLDYVATAHVPLQGLWDAYWEARGKNLRANVKKARNKLAADGVAPTLDCLTDPADVAAALADYGRLETSGWKAGIGTAVAPGNDQGRFYGAMLEAFAARGAARIYRLRFGEQVVAMDLCIDDGRVLVILKTAYDEAHKALSPSVLMRQDEFAALFHEARFERIEFYGKVMEWHTRWTDQQRTLYHLNLFRWPLLQRLHAWRRHRAS